MKLSRFPVAASAAAVLLLTLAACATAEPMTSSSVDSSGECAGIRVVVDFATLDDPEIDQCVDASVPMTALGAAAAAGVEIIGSDAYGDAIVCRVDGRPTADEELRTDTQGPYTETCADLGPGWAIWSVWVDAGSGWELGQEAVNTQMIAPGEAVGFAWQLTDSTEMDAWLPPNA